MTDHDKTIPDSIDDLQSPRQAGRGPRPSRAESAHHSGSCIREIGRVVRTRRGVRPVYISIGHLITLDDAVRLTLDCCTKYRLPEPTRLAHNEVSRLRLTG